MTKSTTTVAPAASTFARLAELAGGKKLNNETIEKRLAALEARAAVDDAEDDDNKTDDTDTDDKKNKKNKKSKEKDEGDGDEGDNDDRPNTKDKTGDDGNPDASVTTTGSIIPYSAEKMKADRVTAAAIIEAGNKRRGEKA